MAVLHPLQNCLFLLQKYIIRTNESEGIGGRLLKSVFFKTGVYLCAILCERYKNQKINIVSKIRGRN